MINSVYLQTMKKYFTLAIAVFLLSSCSLFGKKTGCPTNGSAVGAERIGGDPKATKAANKSKFKGGDKFGY